MLREQNDSKCIRWEGSKDDTEVIEKEKLHFQGTK